MKHVASAVLLAVSLIHLLPLAGVLGSAALTRAYGISLEDPTVILLLRHRAVLFGILGIYFLVAAFRREWQPIAICVALVSTTSFIALCWMTTGASPEVTRVGWVDLAAVVLLVVAALSFRRTVVSR